VGSFEPHSVGGHEEYFILIYEAPNAASSDRFTLNSLQERAATAIQGAEKTPLKSGVQCYSQYRPIRRL
jgi:hypothetical protein